MTRRALLLIIASVLAVSFATPVARNATVGVGESLPARLTDTEFWRIVADFSEPNGHFRSDNLLSNELYFQHVIPDLVRTAKHERVYLGVGPEQNFTYIAALRPRLAFIVDVRRGNLQLHLMYKALFELAADRADFVSRLFSKPRPAGLGSSSTVQQIFTAYAAVDTSDPLFQTNLKAIRDHLVRNRKLDLDDEDLKGIEYVYHQFYWFGPVVHYWSTSTPDTNYRRAPTYADLMLADDGKGSARSYLASEESFQFLKQLHTNNLLVPVVGNFAGPKALRSVGSYLRDRNAIVSAFYLSNVEQYLNREGLWPAFCGNVAQLPLDSTSTFIRSVRTGSYGFGVGLESQIWNMAAEVKNCSMR